MHNRKEQFAEEFKSFVENLKDYTSTPDGQWAIKGFIDVFKNVYSVSSDTKIISKILEIHLFPKMLEFANEHGYKIVTADHQNYYPDISFVALDNDNIRFAVDFKTTYRLPNKPDYCNGFTLGSHGEYFINRISTKNIQFPYNSYLGHFCLGIIYKRALERSFDETVILPVEKLESIISVIQDLRFFVSEKWKIAGDQSGSGNTANIGSVKYIPDIINERGMFSALGEKIFDDYWINYGKIIITDPRTGHNKPIKNLKEFIQYRGLDISKIQTRFVRPKKSITE